MSPEVQVDIEVLCSDSLKFSRGQGGAAYLDLALIFLLLRFSLLILFFLHLALIFL